MADNKRIRETLKMLRKFEDAVRWHEIKGSQDPEDMKTIETTYRLTKRAMYKAIRILGA